MAKKSKGNIGLVATDTYKPRLYLDLQDKDVTMVKDLKIGEETEFCVRGKVVSLEQRERSDQDGKNVKTGSISLENYTVEPMEEETNEYTKMSDDE